MHHILGKSEIYATERFLNWIAPALKIKKGVARVEYAHRVRINSKADIHRLSMPTL